VQDSSSSSSSAADDASPTSSGRFSKYTAGSSWRSASPTPREQREQQQQQREREQQQLPQRESQPEQQQQPEGGRFSNYIAGRSSSSGAPAAPPAADAGSSSSSSISQRFRSSWDAKEAGGGQGGDYLFELGQSDYNTNVDAGQHVGMIDSLFAGNVLGHRSDIADGSLRGWEARTLNHIIGDYYIAPQFMDKVAVSASCAMPAACSDRDGQSQQL
jgi:hypothetical protein